MLKTEVRRFFLDIGQLNLSSKEKNRMLRLVQVRGSNKKNKVLSYSKLKTLFASNKGNITNAVLGPKWNRLVFIDVDFEV